MLVVTLEELRKLDISDGLKNQTNHIYMFETFVNCYLRNDLSLWTASVCSLFSFLVQTLLLLIRCALLLLLHHARHGS